jgi:hypothetical protein
MRLVLHFVAKYGVDAHFERARAPYPATEAGVAGMLRFMQSIEPRVAQLLQEKFEKGVAISEAERQSQEEASTEEL